MQLPLRSGLNLRPHSRSPDQYGWIPMRNGRGHIISIGGRHPEDPWEMRQAPLIQYAHTPEMGLRGEDRAAVTALRLREIPLKIRPRLRKKIFPAYEDSPEADTRKLSNYILHRERASSQAREGLDQTGPWHIVESSANVHCRQVYKATP